MSRSGPGFLGWILILLGGLLLLDSLDVADLGDVLSTYWPVVLIVFGLSIIWRSFGIGGRKAGKVETVSAGSERIESTSVFGDVKLEVASPSFKGGRVSTVIGDVEVDLSKASLANGEQVLKISSVLGDVNVRLPRIVAHSVLGATLIGELKVGDQRKSGIAQQSYHVSDGYGRSKKRLRIDCNQLIGNLSVR